MKTLTRKETFAATPAEVFSTLDDLGGQRNAYDGIINHDDGQEAHASIPASSAFFSLTCIATGASGKCSVTPKKLLKQERHSHHSHDQ